MKNTKEAEQYIGALLQNPNIDEKIIGKLQIAQSMLFVYQAGLMKEDFPIDWVNKELDLEQTPTQFHTVLVHVAIVLSKKTGLIAQEIKRRCEYGLRDFKSYFLLN